MTESNPQEVRKLANALISDLANQERKSVEEKIKLLLGVLRNCEVYLQDYAAGEQTVFKFFVTTGWVRDEIAETRSVLIEKHKLPPDWCTKT